MLLDMFWLWLVVICPCSNCFAALYQVNRTRTLCYSDVAEFVCSQQTPFVSWTVTSMSSSQISPVLSFHAVFAPEERMKSTRLDNTVVRAQLIHGNSSFILTSLTIEATLSATMECEDDTLTYYPLDKSSVELSEIFLTPTTRGSSSYRVTWSPSYYNTSRYMIIVYPPESYTQEGLIIHNTDNSTVHNITIALNDCPHRIYSTFVLKCQLVEASTMLLYRITNNNQMTVHLSPNNEIIQCININMTWGIDFWDDTLPTTSITNCSILTGERLHNETVHCSNNKSNTVPNVPDTTTLNNLPSMNSTIHITSSAEKSSTFVLLGAIIGVVGALTLLILGGVSAIFLAWKKAKNNKSEGYFSRQDLNQPNDQDTIYNHIELSKRQNSNPPIQDTYNHIHSGIIKNQNPVQRSKNDSTEAYSVIQRNAQSYDSIQIPSKSNKNKKRYADIQVSEGKQQTDFFSQVKYSKVNIQLHPADELLNLDTLLIELKSISQYFKQLGSHIGISKDYLDQIESSVAVPYDGLVEVCDAWLRKCEDNEITLTWRHVADILSSMEQHQLSHNIMQVYATGKLPSNVKVTELRICSELANSSLPPPIPPHIINDSSLPFAISVSMKEVQTVPPKLPPKLPPK